VFADVEVGKVELGDCGGGLGSRFGSKGKRSPCGKESILHKLVVRIDIDYKYTLR
jgi:hypothetical protein